MNSISKSIPEPHVALNYIEVFLAEDHEIVRQGIIALLKSEKGFSIAGEASNGVEAMDKIQNKVPDIVLMDLDIPGMNGFECTVALKKIFSNLKILILSAHDNEKYLIDILAAGADAYILKNAHKDDLVYAIKKVMNGGIFISSEFTLNIISKFRNYTPPYSGSTYDITDREMDVLKLIGEGLTNAEIAHRLFTSIRTIETRRKNLLDKTNTNNTATLIRFAVKHGLLS